MTLREGDTKQYGDYELRYDTLDTGESRPRHQIAVHHPDDGRVGYMQWNGKNGAIHDLKVDDDHRRRGLATAMWEWGQDARPKPKHSRDRTPMGDAWARSVGGPLPKQSSRGFTPRIPGGTIGEDTSRGRGARHAGRGKPRSNGRPRGSGAGGPAGAEEELGGGPADLGAGQEGPRPVELHPGAVKDLKALDKPVQKQIHGVIEALARGDQGLQTHALTEKLKGWKSTKASRGHRIIHRDTDDGGIHVGYIGLHEYDKAIRRLTSRGWLDLYHGTSSDAADLIEDEGLYPAREGHPTLTTSRKEAEGHARNTSSPTLLHFRIPEAAARAAMSPSPGDEPGEMKFTPASVVHPSFLHRRHDLPRQHEARKTAGIRMVPPEEYSKYHYPDYKYKTLPRLAEHFTKTTPEYYQEIKDDVAKNGFTTPVLIRTTGPGGRPLKKPQVMEGHHRAAAAYELGLHLPVGDYDDMEDYDAAFKAGQEWFRSHQRPAQGMPWKSSVREGWPSHQRAVSEAQEAVRREYPMLARPLPEDLHERDEELRKVLREGGHPGAEDAFVHVHNDPGRSTSNPIMSRETGAVGVGLHQSRADYGTLYHEAAHLLHMHQTGRQQNEPAPDSVVHGPGFMANYARMVDPYTRNKTPGGNYRPGAGDLLLNTYYESLASRHKQAAREMPTDRIFGPTYGLDHRLFDGTRLKPEVQVAVLERLMKALNPELGPNWPKFTEVYLAGSEASEWTSPILEGNNDFDTLLGLKYDEARAANDRFLGLTDSEIDDELNAVLRRDYNDEDWLAPFGGVWHLTGYFNHDAYDIRDIKPYAAYDITKDEWAVKPPHLPDWSPESFPQGPALWKQAEAIADEIEAILELPEPYRTQQGASLYDHLHEDRHRAFGPGGEGWYDNGNVIEKYLDQLGLWAKLVHLKHNAEHGSFDDGEQRLLEALAAKEADYRLMHRPPNEESGKPLHHYEGGDPEELVPIYRAVPHDVRDIEHNTWISTNPEYAHLHARHATDPKQDWPVLVAHVPKKHLYWDENDENEHGYQGPTIPEADVHNEETGQHVPREDYDEERDRQGLSEEPEQHMGTAVHLPSKVHRFVHDESKPVRERAEKLWQHLPQKAKEGRGSWGEDNIDASFDAEDHAKKLPQEPHRPTHVILRSPDRWEGVSGISWHPDHLHDEPGRYVDVDDDWHHHDFGRMRTEAAREDYGGIHSPLESAAPLHAVDKSLPQAYEKLRHYGGDDETIAQVQKARAKPRQMVTIYRAMPKNFSGQMNKGDWVSLSHDYAQEHADNRNPAPDEEESLLFDPLPPERQYHVYKAHVPAEHVRSGGDDLLEWGYWGPSIQSEHSSQCESPHDDLRSEAATRTVPTDGAQGDVSDSMMVAIVPPAGVAEGLALDDEAGLRAEELHITLLYLGETSDYTDKQLDQLPVLVQQWAKTQTPLQARTQGAGTFVNEGNHVMWAAVDIPGSGRMHDSLADFLTGHGIKVEEKHGFTPHITLKYDRYHVRFLPKIRPESWTVDEIWYCRAGEWVSYPLGR